MDTELCLLFNRYNETVKHMMVDCSKSHELWENIIVWIKNKIGINFKMGDVEKVLGYHFYDKNFILVNFVLLYT